MNINRHNYEEYFILYMDNELSNDERRMVEEFVQLHPDLKEELDILHQFKLTPDTTIFYTGKEDLLKGTDSIFITLSNYEEYLLLYTDNELTAEQKTAVEKFAEETQAVKKELALLQKTKLHPGQIVFPNKETLYRKEEKVRAIPVRWWRAIAAVLILALGLTALLISNKKAANEPVEVAKIPGNEQKTAPVQNPEQSNKENAVALLQDEYPATNKQPATGIKQEGYHAYKQNTNQMAAKDKKSIIKNNQPVSVRNNDPVVVDSKNDKPGNNLPQPLNNPNVNDKAPKNAIAYNDNLPADYKESQTTLTSPGVTNKPSLSSDYIQASDPISYADQDNAGGKKNKLRGFFRKVTRTFEKRTNIDPTDNDNRLLVGGLAIKLK